MKYKQLLWHFAVVVAIQLIGTGCLYYFFEDPNERGIFGDMFGGINTLFSGLAFAGVIFAILIQSKELELQRKELELTRGELSRSGTAQTQQADQMVKAAKFAMITTKVTCLSQIHAGNKNLPGFGNIHALLEKAMKELNEHLEAEGVSKIEDDDSDYDSIKVL